MCRPSLLLLVRLKCCRGKKRAAKETGNGVASVSRFVCVCVFIIYIQYIDCWHLYKDIIYIYIYCVYMIATFDSYLCFSQSACMVTDVLFSPDNPRRRFHLHAYIFDACIITLIIPSRCQMKDETRRPLMSLFEFNADWCRGSVSIIDWH